MTVTLTNGGGAAFNVSNNTCAAGTDATGHCAITFTSPTAGTVTGHASSTLSDLGTATPITVQTDGQGENGSDAVKSFVDARIHIVPSATNEVGQNHTFTVFVEKDSVAGWVPAANEPVTVTLSNGSGAVFNVSSNTCTTGTDATGHCAITFTSPSPGTVTGHASSTLSDLGTATPITVQTDGQGQNGSDVVKTFVDAYITISPPSAVNPINTTHTYTAHVFVNNGSGTYTDAPNGTVVTFAFVGAHVGSFVAGNQCTIANGAGTCTIDTTSTKPGDDTMSASTTLSVGGVSLTRTTGTAAPGHANGDNAVKNWVGAKIAIAPNAANEVGAPHTFTATLSKDTGAGYQPAPNQTSTSR